MAETQPTASDPVSQARARADKVRTARSPWDAIYNEAYSYAIPFRRPQAQGDSKRLADRLFDMTAPSAALHLGGTLQRNIFPMAQGPFTLETGPLLKLQINDRQRLELDRRLERVAKFMHPFFHAGDFDTATLEMCTDLGIGTGAIIPLKGDFERPLIFVCIPTDEISARTDIHGRDSYITWQRKVTYEAVIEGFPQGRFSKEFRETARAHPYSEKTLYQDFWRHGDGTWRFAAYMEGNDQFIAEGRFRTQPIAVTRYHRLSGEDYGRGPILMALPAIKTLNKAQELTLKAAAIQMLGIWGYRAGGTFNPDTVRLGPGEFWPMQSTGGILGPDVSRIDTGGANLSVAQLITEGLQAQIRAALLDDRLPERPGTPEAATTVAARLRQAAQSHIGAFGRLWRETMPVLVPRSAEILSEFGYLDSLFSLNELLVSIGVRSPMASALKAEKMINLANYFEAIVGLFGEEMAPAYVNRETVAEDFAEALMIDKRHIPTEDQKAEHMQQVQAQREAAFAAEALTKAAPQIAGNLTAIDGGRAAA